MLPAHDPCPCTSGTMYSSCCAPLHDGRPAPTALRLMRSRYSAFALGYAGHLLATWHPSTRPAVLDLSGGPTWRRLQIVDTVDGGDDADTGIVEYRAAYLDVDGAGVLHERSRFVREQGLWLYLDGDILG